MTSGRARFLLYLSMAGWGFTFVANHELLLVLDPLQITTLRMLGVSAAFLLLFALVPSKRPRLVRRDWGWLALGGLMVVPGAQILGVTGQRFLAPTMAGLVASTTPALAAVLAYRLLGERLVRQQVIGIAVALAGACTVIVFASGAGTEFVVRNPFGAALLLIAQIIWSLYTVLARKLAVRHDPLTMVATAFILGTAMLLPLLPHALQGARTMPATSWWWLLHLVVGGTLLPHVMWFVALRYLTTNDTAVSMYLVPLWAALFGVTVVGERLAPIGLLGGIGILVGITLAQRRSLPESPVEDPTVVEPGA